MEVKFYKENKLPTSLEENALYFVRGAFTDINITLGDVETGTFTITLTKGADTETTGHIAYNADALTLSNALDALSIVSGSTVNKSLNIWTIEFGAVTYDEVSLNDDDLVLRAGSGPKITFVTSGSSAPSDLYLTTEGSTPVAVSVSNDARIRALILDWAESNNTDKVPGSKSGLYISSTAPASPTEGDLWSDTTADSLKRRDGTSWVEIAGVSNGTALPSNPDVGDTFLLTATHNTNAPGFYICVTNNVWTLVHAGAGLSQSQVDDRVRALVEDFAEVAHSTTKVQLIKIPDLPADRTTSGTFNAARIPNLNASKINAGTFSDARIPNLNASKINAGVFDIARIPNLDANKITTGVFDAARLPVIPKNKLGNVFDPIRYAADITARNNLASSLGENNAIVFVTDASSDPDVPSGAAIYYYAGTSDNIIEIARTGAVTGGTFTLTNTGKGTTTNINWNDGASLVETKIEGINGITDVSVTGSGSPQDPWIISFINPNDSSVVASTWSFNDSALTGGTAGSRLAIADVDWLLMTKFGDDLGISIYWDEINGRPSSSVTDIDQTVMDRHTHANKATLDKLGESGGALTFDGSAVVATVNWSTTAW